MAIFKDKIVNFSGRVGYSSTWDETVIFRKNIVAFLKDELAIPVLLKG